MIYDNTLRSSTLFGLALLLLGIAGTAIWVGAFFDGAAQAFDTPGLIVLGVALGTWTLSCLFFARVRCVRIITSILLHALIVVLAVAMSSLSFGHWTVGMKVAAVALFFLGAGACVVGILVLHGSTMKADLQGPVESPPEVARRRAQSRWIVIAALSVILLVLLYGAWRTVPLLLAKPTITVDYAAEYNRVTKPANYDPNRNAAPHYERFFASFSELPAVLLTLGRWSRWPGDLTALEYQALERWAAENEQALEDLKRAVACPYWWSEVRSEDRPLLSTPDTCYLTNWRHSTLGVVALAQYYAHRGDTERALMTLADLHAMALHGIQRTTLIDQLVASGICQRVYQTLLQILVRAKAEGETLRRTRHVFAEQVPQVLVPRFTPAESVLDLDCIQRVFTDDGSGDGRLIPRELYQMRRHGGLIVPPLSYAGALWICLNHPSRLQTVRAGRRLDAVAEALSQRSPWQVGSDQTSYEQELADAVTNNEFLRMFTPSVARMIVIGWRGKAEGQALVTVLTILVYRAEKGHLPESLEELAESGLLDRAPMDPYSDGPLIYRVTGEDFTLYSVGEDFLDDGGEPGEWDQFGTDRVFWPVVQ